MSPKPRGKDCKLSNLPVVYMHGLSLGKGEIFDSDYQKTLRALRWNFGECEGICYTKSKGPMCIQFIKKEDLQYLQNVWQYWAKTFRTCCWNSLEGRAVFRALFICPPPPKKVFISKFWNSHYVENSQRLKQLYLSACHTLHSLREGCWNIWRAEGHILNSYGKAEGIKLKIWGEAEGEIEELSKDTHPPFSFLDAPFPHHWSKFWNSNFIQNSQKVL